MRKKTAAFIAAAVMVLSCGEAAGAETIRAEGGVKYAVSDSGAKTPYTGYTVTGGIIRYYSAGKQCVGWTNVNGSKYYFLKNGGYAEGDFVIGGKVYTFFGGRLEHGPYDYGEFVKNMPSKTSGSDPDYLMQENSSMVSGFAAKGGRLTGKKYLSDYAGMYWDSEKGRYTIMLTSMKRKDFYAGLGGEVQEFDFVKARFSRNYLEKISDAAYDSDIMRLHKICWVETLERENRVDIKVTEEKKAALLETYLLNKGFAGEAFSVEYEPHPEKYYDDE